MKCASCGAELYGNGSSCPTCQGNKYFRLAFQCAEKEDLTEAVRNYQLAAQLGNLSAQNNLGRMYLRGKGVPCDEKKALELFLNAAEGENKVAQINVGNCYKNGQGVELDWGIAIKWYTRAARQGDDSTCLKLAECYCSDKHPECWNEESARYWYVKATESKDENIRYTAARALAGLSDLSTPSGKKMVLDAQTAFVVFRQLAAAGNREAANQCGYFYEKGIVVQQSWEMAAMWYDKGGNRAAASLCTTKAAGEPQINDEPKMVVMQPKKTNDNLHGKEYYRMGSSSNNRGNDFQKVGYGQKLYYIQISDDFTKTSQVCCSNNDGSEIEVLFSDKEISYFTFLAVNHTGIYLYAYRDADTEEYAKNFRIKRYTHSGAFDREIIIPNQVRDLYLCGERLHYIAYEKKTFSAYYRNMDDSGDTCLISDAADMDAIYANEDSIVFHATFSKPYKYQGQEEDAEDDGWYCFSVATGIRRCLTSREHLPEWIVTQWDKVLDEDHMYICDENKLKIARFDMAENIMWVVVKSVWEGESTSQSENIEYWEAQPIVSGAGRKAIAARPVWRIPTNLLRGDRNYFDGVYFYSSENYYKIYSMNCVGEIRDWSTPGGHGECDKFHVINNHLYIDLTSHGEEQFVAQLEPEKPIGKTWFHIWVDGTTLPAKPVKAINQTPQYSVSSMTRAGATGLSTTKTLTETDIKYKICTFGSGFHIGFGQQVTIEIDGEIYTGKTHKTNKGRIDGLKQMYAKNGWGVDDVIEAIYNPTNQHIIITKV